jgi:5-bromo-4-chloroindolyl phosphate hydrolysis protein
MAEIWKPRTWRWSPRGYLLYLFPVPLIPAALIALLRGKVDILLAEIGAMALLYGGAWLVRQGVKRELDERPRFTRTLPLKTLGYLFTVAGVFVVSSMLVGQSIIFAAIVAALAGVGCLLAYGADTSAQRLVVPAGSDYTAEETSAMLAEASKRVDGLDRAAAAIRDGEITTRLRRIAELARAILADLAQDPRDLRRARKFLNVYLDSAMRVSESYARTHAQASNAELEDRFRNVLVTIERVFGEQQQKLLENDVLELDVQIEVLKTQLEREGVS